MGLSGSYDLIANPRGYGLRYILWCNPCDLHNEINWMRSFEQQATHFNILCLEYNCSWFTGDADAIFKGILHRYWRTPATPHGVSGSQWLKIRIVTCCLFLNVRISLRTYFVSMGYICRFWAKWSNSQRVPLHPPPQRLRWRQIHPPI